LLTADCSFLVEISTVSPIDMTAVSSANVAMVLHFRLLNLLINNHLEACKQRQRQYDTKNISDITIAACSWTHTQIYSCL
jgi:hypothetical protein